MNPPDDANNADKKNKKKRERKPVDPNAPKRSKKKKTENTEENASTTPATNPDGTPIVGETTAKKKRAPSSGSRKKKSADPSTADPNAEPGTANAANAATPKRKSSSKKKKPTEQASTEVAGKEEEKEENEEEEEEEEAIFDEDFANTADTDVDDSAKVRDIIANLTDEQNERYEYYRRSSFTRSNIKKVMQNASGGAAINQKMAIVMGGVAKVFVGELVETSRTIMDEWGDTGPIKPKHLREAYRILKLNGKIPYANNSKKMLFKH